MQIFKTCFLSSQNYLCIGEHTLCPFFKARFFGFKLLIWMRLIILQNFEIYFLLQPQRGEILVGRKIRYPPIENLVGRGVETFHVAVRVDQILNTAFYGPFYAGITAAVSCFVFNRRHRTEDTADTLVSLVV